SIKGVVFLLSKELTRWVLVSNLVAWPTAWWLMNKWLNNFAYRTNLTWVLLVQSGLIVLAVAGITVGYQAMKAARANPVESLKYE
ncbi:hypothetical protein KAR48_14810, partial [bacterium]|nr:hypothetical protein [bacterium]